MIPRKVNNLWLLTVSQGNDVDSADVFQSEEDLIECLLEEFHFDERLVEKLMDNWGGRIQGYRYSISMADQRW